MDPAVCLEHEIRKAQINRASVVSVFFDRENIRHDVDRWVVNQIV